MLKKLIELTSWEIVRPKTYGLFHVCFLIAAFAGTMLLAVLLKNSDEKKNKKILLSCGLFLLFTEIYKQIFFWYAESSVTGEYRWGILSFQMCSIPMYLCLIIPFMKEGRIRDAMYDFLASYNFLGGFTALLEPSGVFNEYLVITVHSLIWHTLLVFLGFYLVASGRAAKKLRDFPRAIALYYCLAFIALMIDIILWEKSGGGINMFFLGFNGPGIFVYQSIFEKVGWFASAVLFTTTLSLGAFICFAAGHWIYGLTAGRGKNGKNQKSPDI
ncbi:MAG: YwaF family protein [Clostridia bacterium]|nr:YwaF family protein [Clostridia bacterium]